MVRAKTHCDVILLNKRDLCNALQHFPDGTFDTSPLLYIYTINVLYNYCVVVPILKKHAMNFISQFICYNTR